MPSNWLKIRVWIDFFYAYSYSTLTPKTTCLWVFLQISQNTIQLSVYNPCDWSSKCLSSKLNCQMPLECWPVVTFSTPTLILLSLEHVKCRLFFILEDKAAVSPSVTETGALCSCLELQNDLHGVSQCRHGCIILSVKWKIKHCYAADILVSKKTYERWCHTPCNSNFIFISHITLCWFYMRRHPYEISDTDICYVWNCVFILHFLVCCNHVWTLSTGEARTKQIHKQGCDCCLRLSQLNGEPQKISGVEGCVLQFITLGPLSLWPWIIARYSPVT
jgi:hypothetical protein